MSSVPPIQNRPAVPTVDARFCIEVLTGIAVGVAASSLVAPAWLAGVLGVIGLCLGCVVLSLSVRHSLNMYLIGAVLALVVGFAGIVSGITSTRKPVPSAAETQELLDRVKALR